MATISRTGIANASTIDASHITNIIDALDGTSASTTVIATGSFSGSFKGIFTGSVAGTASWATTASTAQSASITNTTTGTGPYYITFVDGVTGARILRADSTANALAFNATTNTLTTTASYALTASYATNTNGGSGLQSLQFTHDAWVTASITPVYYGNYPAAPYPSIGRVGVISPYTGTLVSASISGHMDNPGGGSRLSLWAVNGTTSMSLDDGLSAGFIDTDEYFDGFTYTRDPELVTPPFTASFGDRLSIKLQSNGEVTGLNAYTTVTLLFEP